jgi:hypothetical protein
VTLADTRRRRGRLRLVGAGVAVLAFVLLAAWVATPRSGGRLDPDSPSPGGARAVAQVLRSQGIPVQRVTDADQALRTGAGSTLVVAYPELLTADQLDALARSSADVVLLGAPWQATGPFLGLTVVGEVEVRPRQPVCGLPAAVLAGRAELGGAGFALSTGPDQEGDLCYTEGDAATLVQVRDGTRTVTVVGSSSFVTNDRLADDGNAALALNLVGSQPAVVWWLPSPALDGDRSLTSLLPRATWLLLAQAAVVVLLLAWWRGRRLGRVVVEPLPVVVRAAETTEGRARLYQRNRARDVTSAHLREAAVARLLRPLHLPDPSSSPAVVSAVAASTGRPAESVRHLLYGPTPGDDTELVGLARALDALEQEVRPR